MASRITIRKTPTGATVSAPGRPRKRFKNIGDARLYALEVGKIEVQKGFTDVEVHDENGKRWNANEFMAYKGPAPDKKFPRAVLNVILTFSKREQQFENLPVTKAFEISDANVLLHILKTMSPAERAELVKISIAQHAGRRPVSWLVGASAPRQFFFGREYKERAPRRPKQGFIERLFS